MNFIINLYRSFILFLKHSFLKSPMAVTPAPLSTTPISMKKKKKKAKEPVLPKDVLYKDIASLELVDVRIKKYLEGKISIGEIINELSGILNQLITVDEDWRAGFFTSRLNMEVVLALALDRDQKASENEKLLNEEDEQSILESLDDLKKLAKSKLDALIQLEHRELWETDLTIKDIAEDLGKHWLICSLCSEVWENDLEYAMVRCPQCHHRLHNSQLPTILKWSAESDCLPRCYEIKYFPALGYYFYIFENDIQIYDYQKETWEMAIQYGWEECLVPKDSWKKEENKLKVSLDDIRKVFDDLIHDRKPREYISYWASQRQFANDIDNLEYTASS